MESMASILGSGIPFSFPLGMQLICVPSVLGFEQEGIIGEVSMGKII